MKPIVHNRSLLTNRQKWTEEEVEILRSEYANIRTEELARILERPLKDVYAKANSMGLVKSEAFNKSVDSGRLQKLTDSGKAFRFKKGQEPVNKGKKQTEFMSPDAISKTVKTRFKKGNVPHNTKYDGHERISKDGYIEVRLRLGKYVFKHRLIWESQNGPVPKGMCLVFKDGNKRNITLDNLELISRSDLMKRNTIQRFGPELQKTIKVLSKLKRTIHEKQNIRSKKSPL